MSWGVTGEGGLVKFRRASVHILCRRPGTGTNAAQIMLYIRRGYKIAVPTADRATDAIDDGVYNTRVCPRVTAASTSGLIYDDRVFFVDHWSAYRKPSFILPTVEDRRCPCRTDEWTTVSLSQLASIVESLSSPKARG